MNIDTQDLFTRMERNRIGLLLVQVEKLKGLPLTTEAVLRAAVGSNLKNQLAYLEHRLDVLGGPVMRKTRFVLGDEDDAEVSYEGWTYGDLWNGFSKPYLTRNGVERLRLNNANYPGELNQFSWEGDVLVVTPPEESPFKIEPDSAPDGTKVWDCSFGFTWMEVGP